MAGKSTPFLTPKDVPCRADADLWVFGYGSLMWDPGFTFAEQRRAELNGYHRSFCIASHRHRGTPQCPGLVFGLDHGGTCTGIAYRIASENIQPVLDYLWFREMDTNVYHPRLLPIRLSVNPGAQTNDESADGAGSATSPALMATTQVDALCFVVNPDHEQYLGRLPTDQAAEIICRATGGRGPNIDYLLNTANHLRDLGILDEELEALRAAAARLGVADQSSV